MDVLEYFSYIKGTGQFPPYEHSIVKKALVKRSKSLSFKRKNFKSGINRIESIISHKRLTPIIINRIKQEELTKIKQRLQTHSDNMNTLYHPKPLKNLLETPPKTKQGNFWSKITNLKIAIR